MVTGELWRMREKLAQAANLTEITTGLPPAEALRALLDYWQPEGGDPAMQAVLLEVMPHLATIAGKLLHTIVQDTGKALERLEAPATAKRPEKPNIAIVWLEHY
jgi:hypothetical protein